MNKLIGIVDQYRLGDLASLVGLFVSVVGFVVTIYGVWKSKSAAQRAAESSQRTQEAMAAMRSIADVSTILASLEEVKRLHRAPAWSPDLLLDRYGGARTKLVALRESLPHLSENQQATLQGTIQHLANFEALVERTFTSPEPPANLPRRNLIISAQIDKLTELLVQLQREEIRHG